MSDARLEFLGEIADHERARFMKLLRNTRVRIVAAEAISRQRDLQIAALRGADILGRLFDDVCIEIEAPWARSAKQSLVGRSGVSDEPKQVVTVALGDAPGDLHVGYQNGELLVAEGERLVCSASDPAASLAGPALAAEVFKLCFEPHISGIVRRDYALPIGLTKDARHLIEGDVPLNLLIAGGGSVGFAFVDALSSLGVHLSGNVTVVDNGTLEERNVVKYPALDLETALSRAPKTEILRTRLSAAYPRAVVEVHNGTIQTYDGPAAEIAVVSMDNVAARRSVQELLSRDIVNIAVEGTRFEVSSLTFAQTGCIYCYYRDNPEETQSFQVIAERLGLEIGRIEQLMSNNEPLAFDDVQRCSAHLGLELQRLLQFVDQPLRSMVPRLYAQTEVRVPGGSVHISTAFVSAMAGALGALEVLKAAQPEFRSDRRSVSMDMLGVFHDLSLREIPRRPDCAICNGKVRRNEYARLWTGSVCA